MNNSLSYADISSGYRFIKNGSAFEHYFPKPDRKDDIKIFDGDVDDTVGLMRRVVWTYINDTAKIAPVLKRNSVKDTCQSVWEFTYKHLQYKFDRQGLEQLRRPARSWAERKTGVDCDCMSIFISSILTNLQIPHSFRITKYSKPSWQHVYVVVPDKSGTIVLDAVVSRFNYEKPYKAKKDYVMDLKGIDVAVLSGYDDNDALSEALFGFDLGNNDDELGAVSQEEQLAAIYRHLVTTRNAVAKNPRLVAGVDDPQGFLKMLDYAITYWHTDKRQEALDNLTRFEDQLNIKNGFAGDDDLFGDDDEGIYGDLTGYTDLDELGFIKPKKLFKNIGKAVKKVGATAGKGIKAVGKGVAKAAKVVGKTILKFNPLTIAARAGFLLAVRLNMKKMASKIKWGYATQQQAAQKKISAADWQKSKNALSKIEKLYVSKLQGSASSLKNAVLKGKAGNLNGIIEYVEDFSEFQGLGILPAAALAAAIPLIAAAMKILKETGLIKPGENTDTNNLEQELDSSSTSVMQSIEAEDPEIRQVPQTGVAVQTAQAALVPYQAASPMPAPASGGGVMDFIKANPIPSLVIGGVVAFGAYQLLKPKSTGVNGLGDVDGLDGTKKRSRKRKTKTASKPKAAKKKPAKKKAVAKGSIRRIKLF